MPTTMQQSDFLTLQFIEEDASGKPPLINFMVEMWLLDSDGQPVTVSLKRKTDGSGKIRINIKQLPFAINAGIESIIVLLKVFGLDHYEIASIEQKLELKKYDYTINVQLKEYRRQLAGSLNTWSGKLTEKLKKLFEENKIETLSALRKNYKKLKTTQGLTKTDLQLLEEINNHSQLQLICRDQKTNEALIKAEIKDVVSIASLSKSAFVALTKDSLAKGVPEQLYDVAIQKCAILKNKALEKKVNAVNGFPVEKSKEDPESDALPCSCDCQSALSPLAYLSNLLDFVFREVEYENEPLSFSLLESFFHQPFAAMPADCSASEEIVRQVRICIEVLRRKLEKNGKPLAESVTKEHARKVYDSLLEQLGTSYRELRLLRGAPEEDRERKADALGIAESNLNNLLLQERTLNENTLESLFGWQDTERDPLSYGAKLSDTEISILRWQLKGVEWGRNTDQQRLIYGLLQPDDNGKYNLTLSKDNTFSNHVATAEGKLPEKEQPLQLKLTPQNDSGLSGTVTITYKASKTDFKLAVVPEFLTWQFLELFRYWLMDDHPKVLFDSTKLPIVDPDMLTKASFCRPLTIKKGTVYVNAAFKLWSDRSEEIIKKYGGIDKKGDSEDSEQRPILEMIQRVDPLNGKDWDTFAKDLNSEDEDTIQSRMDDLEKFYLTIESFGFLYALRKDALSGDPTISDPEIEERKKKEREQLLDILVNVVKRRELYPKWITEENQISLCPTFFCLSSSEEPFANPFRVVADEYTSWQGELERFSRAPVIDPDTLYSMPNIELTDSAAAELRNNRRQQLDTLYAGINEKFKPEKLDGLLGYNSLTMTGGQILLHPLGFDNLDDLQTDFDKQALDIQPQMHGLTWREFNALFAFRKLVKENSFDETDKQQIIHIFIQVEKRRYLYPAWLVEEADKNITCSPQFYRNPDQAALQWNWGDDRPAELIDWRTDSAVTRSWLSTLKGRFQQMDAQRESLRAAMDSAEQVSLPALRDALIDAVYQGNITNREENKTKATNELLINAFENGCRKTRRVAQAFETIQLLVWGILNGQIEDQKFQIPELNQDNFDAAWAWLKSYGDWHAAMSVFLYPENILYPTLRSDQTILFQAIVSVLDGSASQSEEDGDSGEDNSDEETEPISPEDELKNLLTDNIFKIILKNVAPQSSEGISRIHRGLSYLRANEYSYVGQLHLDKYNTINENSEFIENILYLPLHFALVLQQIGEYEAALQWFRKIYDFHNGRFNENVREYFDQQSSESFIYNGENWLSDTLNPHNLSKTRSNVLLRSILISITRCLLDYAEAEFAGDTSESLGRARELYLTARRLLAMPALKQNLQDCEGALHGLIIEVGERYREYDFQQAVVDEAVEHDPRINSDQIPDILENLDKIFEGPELPMDKRKKIRELFKTYSQPSIFENLDTRVSNIGIKQNSLLREQLEDLKLFDQVLQMGNQFALGSKSGGSKAVMDGMVQSHWTPIPGVSFEFCIPPNKLLLSLNLRTENGLYKLNNCMNLAGMYREVPAYVTPTDITTELQGNGVGGGIGLPQTVRLSNTHYRYKTLVERAKYLVQIAQQLETTYLSFLEKFDQESYNIMKARQDLNLSNANVTLQGLRVTEAKNSKGLADLQYDKTDSIFKHYEDLLEKPLLETEQNALNYTLANAMLQGTVALISAGGAIAAGLTAGGIIGAETGPGSFFTALGGGAGALAATMTLSNTAYQSTVGTLSAASSYNSMVASFKRREQEWEFQKALANFDIQIAEAQKTLADDHYQIVLQEQSIATISAGYANDTLNFLNNKFTSKELYSWMSGIIGSVYRYFLEQATAIAKLAQMQLTFERQETGIDFILSDYWSATSARLFVNSIGDEGESKDRRGMTGSARLLQDIYKLDQYAFTTDRRKLQMSKTISLAMHDPIAFYQFRQSGVFPFSTNTKKKIFDYDFPGHYLRLIKRVRTSVIALIPPTQGIKATLSNTGISYVVVSDEGGALFEQRVIRRQPESVALTAAINDSGVFELQEQPEMMLPFEGMGVEASWEFRMPKAANQFDFNTITDVLITIEYTALDSPTYRQEVIRGLDPSISADRPFSIRQQFADAWYDLNNPDTVSGSQAPMSASFNIKREDFPPNVSDIKIDGISIFVSRKPGVNNEITFKHIKFVETGSTSAIESSATSSNGIIRSAGGLSKMKDKQPFGEWTLGLEDKQEIRELFKSESIDDILFVITFTGHTEQWPS
nr:neuraminidase-like domain-containing protein [uncultured Desulfobacter sp.]